MGWVRVSDDFYDHGKFVGCTALGIGMWIVGMAYCNRNRTDGRIPGPVARRLVNTDGLGFYTSNMSGRDADAGDAVAELVDAELWHDENHDCPRCPQPAPGGYIVHDYSDYQPTADEMKRRAEEKAEAGRKGAESRWGKAEPMAPAMAEPMAPAMAAEWQSDAPNPKPNTNPNPNPQNLKTSSSPLRSDVVPAGFVEFWAHYPRKVGKGAAAKAYRKALKTTDCATLLGAVRCFAADPNLPADKNFIPHPSTWLNEGRWDDEPLPDRSLRAVPSRVSEQDATLRRWHDEALQAQRPEIGA